MFYVYHFIWFVAFSCSVFHVIKQSKAGNSPGEIALQAFFISFAILGSSCLWWIFTIVNDITQGLGVLFNGLVLGVITQANIHLAFYFYHHPGILEPKLKNTPEEPRFI